MLSLWRRKLWLLETAVKLLSLKQEMYLKQQRATKAPIVAFYKLHKPGCRVWRPRRFLKHQLETSACRFLLDKVEHVPLPKWVTKAVSEVLSETLRNLDVAGFRLNKLENTVRRQQELIEVLRAEVDAYTPVIPRAVPYKNKAELSRELVRTLAYVCDYGEKSTSEEWVQAYGDELLVVDLSPKTQEFWSQYLPENVSSEKAIQVLRECRATVRCRNDVLEAVGFKSRDGVIVVRRSAGGRRAARG